MANKDTVHVPKGFQLTIFTDAFSSGHYYVQGNPGQQPEGLGFIAANSSTIIKPTNENRQYAIVSDTGNITYEVDFHYVEEVGENELEDLDNVEVTNKLVDDIIKWDGTNWVNTFNTGGSGAAELDELSDVAIAFLQNRDALIYDSVGDIWENRAIIEADISDLGNYLLDINSESIDDLNDVNIVVPSNGQVLTYTAGVWSNEDAATTYTDEMAQDAAAALIQNGTGITWAYNDVSNTLTPTITITQYTDELAQDAVGTILANSTFVNLTYVDATPTITATLSATGTPSSTTFLRGDNTWATPSAGGVTLYKYVSTHWYGSGGIVAANSNAAAQRSTNTGTLYFVPFMVTQSATFTDISVWVGTTSAGNINMGLYNDSGSGKPTGSPIANSQSGSVTSAASSLISYTFSSPITLSAGIYWAAITISATNSLLGAAASATHLWTQGLDVNPDSTIATTPVVGWGQTFTYSATLPTVGTLSAVRLGVGDIFVFLKAQ